MNRRKKINETLKRKAKKANSKKQNELHKSKKPKYISKAERERLSDEAINQTQIESSEQEL
ncbi:MAG: DUF2986 domain-containing protein [Gammaproteobacteria bacterium]|nr:DUF2986 domain-containing protein [Gammaproteobacteria bacterium]